MSESLVKQSVVIIGGGVAGQATAKELLNANCNVIIVQANSFVEVPHLSPYYLSRPDQWEKTANTKAGSIASLDNSTIDGVKYVIGTVSKLEVNSLILTDNRTIDFDVCVCATGIHYPFIAANCGEDFNERKSSVKQFHDKLNDPNTKSILIGGSGPVAVEVAGELRRLKPNMKIQMVTSGDNVLPSWKGKPAQVVMAHMKDVNIEIITNSRLIVNEEQSIQPCYEKTNYKLSNDNFINDVDIFLPYFGIARTQFLSENYIDKQKRSLIKSNVFGQSIIQKNLFVVGCSTLYSHIVIDNIFAEASVVGKNIIDVLNGKEISYDDSAKLSETAPAPVLMYAHFGLGTWTAMNLEQLGCFPGFCGWMCGCGFPLCPCAAPCGWPCQYPASEFSSKCLAKLVTGMGNPGVYHETKAPDMFDMTRA
jgi:NADH dehydrogenase FAD-containing subunit